MQNTNPGSHSKYLSVSLIEIPPPPPCPNPRKNVNFFTHLNFPMIHLSHSSVDNVPMPSGLMMMLLSPASDCQVNVTIDFCAVLWLADVQQMMHYA